MMPCWAYWASKKCTKNKLALNVGIPEPFSERHIIKQALDIITLARTKREE